jgi:mRNA interferase MazF
MGMVTNRFDVFLISLDPTRGSEIRKTRPCLIISPDEMNHYIKTVIIAPMTTKGRGYPSRVSCTFQDKRGQVVLDQIRTVDKARLVRKLGQISSGVQVKVLDALQEMFAK